MFCASSLLKNTRLDKEYELADIAKKLKINSKYLKALEDDDVVNFPQEPYCSLMVKEYADYLGLNGQDVLSLFRRDFEQKKKTKSLRKESFSFTPQLTFTFSIALIIFVFAIYLVSEYFKFNRPPKLKVDWPTESIIINDSFILTGITDPESTVRVNQDLIIVDTKGAFSKKISLNQNNETKIIVESKSPSGKTTIEEKILK